MCNWIIHDGELCVEHVTSEGVTLFTPEAQVGLTDTFVAGFETYSGAELLLNKPS